jgi:hypothetical protein
VETWNELTFFTVGRPPRDVFAGNVATAIWIRIREHVAARLNHHMQVAGLPPGRFTVDGTTYLDSSLGDALALLACALEGISDDEADRIVAAWESIELAELLKHFERPGHGVPKLRSAVLRIALAPPRLTSADAAVVPVPAAAVDALEVLCDMAVAGMTPWRRIEHPWTVASFRPHSGQVFVAIVTMLEPATGWYRTAALSTAPFALQDFGLRSLPPAQVDCLLGSMLELAQGPIAAQLTGHGRLALHRMVREWRHRHGRLPQT